jgi:hypothetical protein
MNTGTASVYLCSTCGGYFTDQHFCPGHRPPFGSGAFTPTPLTEDRVREIVREEMARTSGVPVDAEVERRIDAIKVYIRDYCGEDGSGVNPSSQDQPKGGA